MLDFNVRIVSVCNNLIKNLRQRNLEIREQKKLLQE
jgi:hypothetical protein